MTMALKYQVLLSMSPRDILLITLNHMDAVRKFVEGNDQVMEQVNNVYKLLYQVMWCYCCEVRGSHPCLEVVLHLPSPQNILLFHGYKLLSCL